MVARRTTWLLSRTRRCNVSSPLWRDVTSTSFSKLERSSYVNPTLCSCPIVFNGHLLLNFNQNWQQLNRGLLQQREPGITDNTDLMQRGPLIWLVSISSLSKLCNIKLTLILAFIQEVMRNLNSTIRMEDSLLVFMNLAQQSTYLHMGLAFVL